MDNLKFMKKPKLAFTVFLIVLLVVSLFVFGFGLVPTVKASPAHTFDTKYQGARALTNPYTFSYTLGSGTTLFVLSIVVGGTTARAGGAPTYNGVALTQADQNRQSTETFAELWYLLNPPVGSAYTVSIPNTGAVYLSPVASSYKTPSGYTSVYKTAKGGTGTSTNPTGPTLTGLASGDVIVAVVGTGAQTWAPTGRTGTQLYDRDDGTYGNGAQYLIKTDSNDVAMGWTFGTSDDWAVVEAAFQEVPEEHSILRVQGNARGTTTGNSISVTMASTPTSGNVLVATIGAAQYTAYITVNSITQTGVTWTYQISKSGKVYSRVTSEIWFGVVGAGASTSVTIALSGTADYGGIADICEYSGVATDSFLDKTATSSGYNKAPSTGTTATTTQEEELWIGATFAADYIQATPTNGFSLLDGEVYTYRSLAYLEKIVSATGTASSGTATSSSTDWAGCIATFKAAAPPTAEWYAAETWRINAYTLKWFNAESWKINLHNFAWFASEIWRINIHNYAWFTSETWRMMLLSLSWNIAEIWRINLHNYSWFLSEIWRMNIHNYSWFTSETWKISLHAFNWFLAESWLMGLHNFSWFTSEIWKIGLHAFNWFNVESWMMSLHNYSWFPSEIWKINLHTLNWFTSELWNIKMHNYSWFNVEAWKLGLNTLAWYSSEIWKLGLHGYGWFTGEVWKIGLHTLNWFSTETWKIATHAFDWFNAETWLINLRNPTWILAETWKTNLLSGKWFLAEAWQLINIYGEGVNWFILAIVLTMIGCIVTYVVAKTIEERR